MISSGSPSWLQSAILLTTGVAVGSLVTTFLVRSQKDSPAMAYARYKRKRLPKTIILVRHGESEANADKTMWKKIPDNLMGLTAIGKEQAIQIGRRISKILVGCHRVHLVVSPFERTLQTAAAMRSAFEHLIVRTDIESRIREQEMGNLQNEAEFRNFRKQQLKVGRFWYRFPTGESGADVLDRVKSWWFESVLTVNMRVGYESIDAMVVVTHGLTMRFILMQLFGWSPTTFHSVWNAGNCDIYVLRKDLSKPGPSPYILDNESGDMPRSSIEVMVTLKSTQQKLILKLENYLSIPPPRTTRIDLVKCLLAEQYPSEVKADDVDSIVFMPFVEGGIIKGRSTSGVASKDLEKDHRLEKGDRLMSRKEPSTDGLYDSDGGKFNRHAKPETSLRFPCIKNVML